ASDRRLGSERQHDVNRATDVEAEERLRKDADDGKRPPVDREGPADDVIGAAEASLPEPMTDHGDQPVRSTAALVVGRGEDASTFCGYTENAQKIPAGVRAIDEVRLAPVGQVERGWR